MNQWSLINNPIINEANQNSRELPKVQKSYTNTLKTIKTVRPSTVYGSNTIYGNTFLFDIPRQWDNLAQLHIVATINGNAQGSIETYFATKIFSEIILQTKNGNRLMKIDPNYTAARLDEIFDQQLYFYITSNLEPPQATGMTPAFQVTIPLFFFFSEEIGNFLHTRKMEPLELFCVVNKDAQSMGIVGAEIVSASFELKLTYHDTNDSSAVTDYPQILNKETKYFDKLYSNAKSYLFKVPKKLIGSFDVYSEQIFPVAANQTYSKVYLKCNYPAYVMHIALIDPASTARNQVLTARLTVGGDEVFNIGYGQNYSMYGQKHSFLENGTFTYWFSIEQSRNRDSGLIIFSESMANTYLEITNTAIADLYYLYVFYEYKTDLELDDNGMINTNKGYSRIRQQWNNLN